MRLIDAAMGQRVKVTGVEGGGSLRSKLTQYGLYAGDVVRVLREAPLGGPLLIEVAGREIALGRGVAEKIHVEAE
jgi:Fe2+ transport system protein FeoA